MWKLSLHLRAGAVGTLVQASNTHVDRLRVPNAFVLLWILGFCGSAQISIGTMIA